MTGVNTAAGTQVLTLTANTGSGANAINGTITDSTATALTGVTKAGLGAWTLSAANNYSGTTTVTGGTLNITGTNASTAGSPITFGATANGVVNINSSGTVNAGAINFGGATGGVLNLNAGTLLANGGLTSTSATVNALNFNGGTLKSGAAIAISGNLNIGVLSGNSTVDTTGGNITSASGFGNTASPGNLTVTGGNTLQSAFNATFTGNLTVSGSSTVKLVTTAAVYTGLWTVGTGSTLDINNVGNYSFGGLAGGGNVVNTGASAVRTITITGAGGNTLSGSIQQPTPSATSATGLTLNLSSSAATQTLSGTNTYGGPTAITQGTLIVNGGGSLGNTAVTVSAGRGRVAQHFRREHDFGRDGQHRQRRDDDPGCHAHPEPRHDGQPGRLRLHHGRQRRGHGQPGPGGHLRRQRLDPRRGLGHGLRQADPVVRHRRILARGHRPAQRH